MAKYMAIWVAAIIFIEAVVEIEVESELFKAIRARLMPSEHSRFITIRWYINGLFSCGYCLSVWVSAIVALFVPTKFINDGMGSLLSEIVDCPIIFMVSSYIISVFVLHRFSNCLHELIHRWINRMPYIMAFRPVSDFSITNDIVGGINGKPTTDNGRGAEERIGIEPTISKLPTIEQEPRPEDSNGRV